MLGLSLLVLLLSNITMWVISLLLLRFSRTFYYATFKQILSFHDFQLVSNVGLNISN